MEKKTIPIPDVQEYYINTSLYTKIPITNKNKNSVFNLLCYQGTIDCYCHECGQPSVFQAVDNRPRIKKRSNLPDFPVKSGDEWDIDIENIILTSKKTFECSRNKNHQLIFYSFIINSHLEKIGQFPSIAGIKSYGISKFKKILGDKLHFEFKRAIGLYAHGVGIGSFVYLRRIIENFIIKQAYEKAKTKKDWDEDEYQKSRLTERIKKLKEFLPEYLVKNRSLYSIVSKGIHELTEEECIEYFPVLRECIEYVLTELNAKRETEIKKEILSNKLVEIAGKIKKE